MLRGNIISVIVGWIVNTDCKREFESVSYGWTCWESWFLAFLSQSVTNVTIIGRDSQKLDSMLISWPMRGEYCHPVSHMSGLVCDKFTRSAEYKELGEHKKHIIGSHN